MRSKYLVTVGAAVLLATSFAGLPRAYQQETVDLASIEKIKAIGLDPNASKVMEIASYLTDVYGPRLSGSANIKRAGDWTVAEMKKWGLVNAALEPWPADPSGQNGGFPCGWTNEKFYLAAVTPQAFPIHGTPTAWTPGTQGLVRGEVVYIPSDMTEEQLKEKFAGGKLKGKWVIGAVAPDVDAFSTPRSVRYTTEQLDRMENPPPPAPADPNAPARGGRAGQVQGGRADVPPAAAAAGAPAAGRAAGAAATPAPPPPPPPVRKDVCKGETPDPAWVKAQADAQAAAQAAQAAAAAAAAANPATAAAGGAQGAGAAGRGGAGGRGGQGGGGGFNRNTYLREQGILGTFTTPAGGRGGGVTGHGVYTIGGGGIGTDPATKLTSITISPEDYGRIYRMVTKGVPVIVEADIRSTFTPNPPMFNVIGEIRGTDKADEVVMLGAHFDSWHASTGATDNAAGSAAMLEAMRILKVSGVRLRRTVRIGLWSGEEQGLIGSRLYVQQHFGGGRGGGRGGAAIPTTPEHAKFSGYFNIDNGTGAIRGVYLQNNAAVGPIFKAWMEPFKSIGMTHVTAGTTGGTDHGSFDNAGLPGWQFIQDGIEYGSLTHHTNLDSYERLQADDMRKNATIAAAFAFLAANREQLLPRKPPAAAGAGRGGDR